MSDSGAEPRALVDAARTGDPDAWEALYRRAYPRLFAYARRRVGTDEQAEDAVSETMTGPSPGSRRSCGPARESTAGCPASRNVVLESYRDGARAAPTDPASVPEPVFSPAGPRDPLDEVLSREESATVLAAFHRLPASDRELLEMRVIVGLDSRQVAEVTGRRPGAVRTAQSRALARLRVEFEGMMT